MRDRDLCVVIAVVWSLALVGCSTLSAENGDADAGEMVSNDVSSADDASPTDDTSSTQDASPPQQEGPECPASAEEPAGLMLTWQDDPTTTMTIDWHTDPDDEGRPTLCWKEAGDDVWKTEVEAEVREVPAGDRVIHRVELRELEPGGEYRFQAGEFERQFGFRTMPADIDDEPVVFATGGDTQHAPHFLEKTNRVAMEYDLDFVAWGGDLAYADGGSDLLHVERWDWWFEANMETLIDDDGRVVPILVGPGNHEVVEGYYFEHADYEPTDAWRMEVAPYFFSLFAFPGQPGYASLDFGDYMTMIFLDSDHTNPVEGEQTQWLEQVLEERAQRDIPHVFPIYHVAAYPSYRDFDGEIQTRIRQHWVPLFEEHGVEVVFEKHDHTYKRTHPIRGGEVDEEEGIVYVGDGAWGVLTREVTQSDAWYIDEFSRRRHALIVTLKGDERHVLMVTEEGEEFDEFGPSLR